MASLKRDYQSQEIQAEFCSDNYDAQSHNCADFVRAVLGINHKTGNALTQDIYNKVHEIAFTSMSEGDIIFNNNFSHCGVCVGYPYVVHYTSSGVICETYIYQFGGGHVYRLD